MAPDPGPEARLTAPRALPAQSRTRKGCVQARAPSSPVRRARTQRSPPRRRIQLRRRGHRGAGQRGPPRPSSSTRPARRAPRAARRRAPAGGGAQPVGEVEPARGRRRRSPARCAPRRRPRPRRARDRLGGVGGGRRLVHVVDRRPQHGEACVQRRVPHDLRRHVAVVATRPHPGVPASRPRPGAHRSVTRHRRWTAPIRSWGGWQGHPALGAHLGGGAADGGARAGEVAAADGAPVAQRVDVDRLAAGDHGHLLAGDDQEGVRGVVVPRGVDAEVVLGQRREGVPMVAVPGEHLLRGVVAVAERAVGVQVAAQEGRGVHVVAEHARPRRLPACDRGHGSEEQRGAGDHVGEGHPRAMLATGPRRASVARATSGWKPVARAPSPKRAGRPRSEQRKHNLGAEQRSDEAPGAARGSAPQ